MLCGVVLRRPRGPTAPRPHLQAGALVGQLADAVHHVVDHVPADAVVAAGVVVGGVLLPRDELLGVVQAPVRAHPDLVCGQQIALHEPSALRPRALASGPGTKGNKDFQRSFSDLFLNGPVATKREIINIKTLT